jgi:hypothetical protein
MLASLLLIGALAMLIVATWPLWWFFANLTPASEPARARVRRARVL